MTDAATLTAQKPGQEVPDRPSSAPSGATLPALLLQRAERVGAHVALRKHDRGRWKTYTWADYAQRAARVGLGLRALGVGHGDRVAIHSLNRPAWLLADLGTQGIGAVTVGIYPTSPAAEVEYLLSHSGSKVLIAEDEEQVDKAMAVRERCPDLRRIVVIDPRGVRELDDPAVLTLAELEALGAQVDEAEFAEEVERLDPDQVAIIVYTSGTTGPPKGAMLSHRNLLQAAESGEAIFGSSPDDEVLSYLPLCHIAERLVSVIDAVPAGYVVNFGGGVDTLAADLQAVQPTFFLGVPRVWEKLLAGVETRMQDASWLKRRVYRAGMARGERLAAHRLAGRWTVADRVWSGLWWLLLFRPMRDKLGLRRIRLAVSGAAPIAPEVLQRFWAMGVPVIEGYGQTENTAQATACRPDAVRIGTVGQAVPGAEVRIADDGEILTRGPGTFLGYFRDEAATEAAIDAERWLHTGDVGELDEDGFLTITDRKKDLIITAGGKNVSPSEIENHLKVSPYVREAVVIGDGRSYLTALIGVEADTVGDWCARRGIPYTTYEDLSRRPEVRQLIADWVDEVNGGLSSVEQIKRFSLLGKELDHEDGEVTATQKVKRRAIAERFSSEIEALYDGSKQP